MRTYHLLPLIILTLVGIGVCSAAFGAAIVWVNADTGNLYFKDNPSVTTPAEAIEALVAGPGPAEMLMNLTPAIPGGTTLKFVQFTSNGAVINLSREAAAGLDDLSAEVMFRQCMYTLRQFGLPSKCPRYSAPCP